ncbi:glucose-6-phosphate dehydrogenase [Nakamurella sp.]|uniref:glucose-6-phosphate dehydrogenase n=1 Tax=Nakamurella sp. TaxID=1869182 RepID=UPI003B3AF090
MSALTRPDTPVIIVLFGATGDLAKRMVLPAFFTLAEQKLMPEDYLLIGTGRGQRTDEEFAQHIHDALTEFASTPDPDEWARFSARVRFAGGGFTVDDPGELVDAVAKARQDLGESAQLINYFAVPPVAFQGFTAAIGAHGLATGCRAVYEKPFGSSPEDFRTLNAAVHEVLQESQVYRIDHFLGKEATQDLHVLRFANSLFANAWNAEHIESVQIDAPETLDIDDRAGFYDATGAMLDMVITHLFQVAAEVAMERPASMDADALQSAREEVIGCFRPLDPAEVVLGQYEGYRDVPGIAPDSTTDTFVAARMWVDNDRWRGVPFLLRTGKRMAESTQRVSVVLKPPADAPFAVPADGGVLSFSLAGNGAVNLSMVVKEPGPGLSLVVSDASIVLGEVEGADALPPYVRLIHDVLIGDRSLFTRPDGLASAWNVLQPVLDHRPAVQPYPQGSWGPAAAADLATPGRWLLGQ